MSTYLNVDESDIIVSVSAGSIKVVTYIRTTSSSEGLALQNKLKVSLSSLSSTLNVTIESIDTYVEAMTPSPPPSSADDFTYWYWLSPTLVVIVVVISYFSIYTVVKNNKSKFARAKISSTVQEKKFDSIREKQDEDYIELIPLTKKKTKLPTCRKDIIPT